MPIATYGDLGIFLNKLAKCGGCLLHLLSVVNKRYEGGHIRVSTYQHDNFAVN